MVCQEYLGPEYIHIFPGISKHVEGDDQGQKYKKLPVNHLQIFYREDQYQNFFQNKYMIIILYNMNTEEQVFKDNLILNKD